MRFEAELDLAQPSYRCNCSICRRNRFWPAIAKVDGMHDRWDRAPAFFAHL